jgi:hypothetical protein
VTARYRHWQDRADTRISHCPDCSGWRWDRHCPLCTPVHEPVDKPTIERALTIVMGREAAA